MTKQEILQYFEEITKYLEQKKLKRVFEMLGEILSYLQNWQLQDKINTLEDTYKVMLRYLVEGAKDPEREKIFTNIVLSLYSITDIAALQIRTSNDNSFFYERRRSYRFYIPESCDELLFYMKNVLENIALLDLLEEGEKERQLKVLQKKKENLTRKIFYTVWLSDFWTPEEKKRWLTIVNSTLDPVFLPCIIITALTLNLLEIFDENKAALLFEAAQSEKEDIMERALIGIVLFLRKYNNRLYLYPALNERLNLLAENPKFTHHIRHILLQFILSKETEKITKKIKDELLPEMIKMGPKITNRIKLDDLTNDVGTEDKNPEWQMLIEESGLQDKLQELSELQMEGADVMHSSFTHLKNYPFFNDPVNWFIPFSTPSEAIGNKDLTQLASVLQISTLLCNSDKYSFYLSVSQMPVNYRKAMIGQFSAESNAIKDVTKEDLFDPSKTIDYRIRQYIQDLYRFYKLHPRRKDFEDIFEIKPEFYNVPSIFKLINTNESLPIIGEYYFNKNYFEEASDIFDMLLQKDINNSILHQKKGYCLQMTGNLEGALAAYREAELLNVNNSWTIKKLAYCYRMLKNPNEALFYYKKAEQLNPGNLSVQMNIGHCYLELKDYTEALKYYFKVEYLANNKEKAWRTIGWCSFMLRKYQQAEDYFNRIIESNPTSTDYLNAGHVQLALGKNKEALRLYYSALRKSKQPIKDFIDDTFSNDISDLIQIGIKEEIIPFILDSFMYNYKE
jgi:tetratricopeptide (TPR) repeat protein